MTDQMPAVGPRNSRISHVARSSLLIAAFFAVDKALGLFRQVVIGRQFGVGASLDAFNAANNLPDLLFALISGGALSVAFIPVLSEHMAKEGRESLWALFSRVANLAFLATGTLALVIALFAKPLVRAELGIAPGFNPELQDLVAELMRLNLIATMLFSMSGLVSAGLQSNQHFLLPALAPVVYDLGQIFGAVILAPEEGYQIAGLELPAAGLGVHGLVVGVIIGAALHLCVQIPALVRYRFRWSPRLELRHSGLRKVLVLMGPRILTIGAFQLIFVIQDNLASRLDDVGHVTALAYGWLIMQVPETVIATALGIAILPTLAERFSRGDEKGLEASVSRAVRGLLSLNIPAAILLMIVIRPLVQLAFGFDARGTELVVWAARAYLVGLVAHSLLEVVARTFYARQNARTPLLASALNAAIFIPLSILLFRPLGASGIGLSNSLAFTFEALFLLFILARNLPGVIRQGRVVARAVAGTALAGALLYGVMRISQGSLPILAAGTVAAGLILLPFVWKDVRQIMRV